jgi:hypothetical protein
MEPGMYMTGIVFAIGALHLVTRVVTYVSRYYAESASVQARAKKAPVQRDDWYMFFHRSQLTGEPEKNNITRPIAVQPSVSSRINKRRDSRPALRRYSA